MHWPKDLGEWGFYLGVVALILALPLNILANFISPRLKDWWSTRSRHKLIQRISFLEARLLSGRAQPPMTPAEDEIHGLIYRMSSMIRVSFHLVYVTVLMMATAYGTSLPGGKATIIGLFLMAAIGILFNQFEGLAQAEKRILWVDRTTRGQAQLQQQIDALKSKLT
jgi:hypothetical protein